MKEFVQRIYNWRKINFVKDTLIMQAGVIFTTLVNILASVIFARILLPEKFGIYGLVFTFSSLVTMFTNWGVEKAGLILLAEAYEKKDKEKIKEVIIYFVKSMLIISLSVGILAIFIAPLIAKYLYGDSYIGKISSLVIASSLASMFFEIMSSIYQVIRKNKNYVLLGNLRNVLRVIFGISLVFSMGVLGILLGHFVAFWLSLVLAVFLYHRLSATNELFPRIREIFSDIRKVKIKKHLFFGFSIAINENISRLYGTLPVLFLSLFYPVSSVGYFNIAMRYVSIPLTLVTPVSQLLSVRLPQLKASNNPLFARNFFKTSIVSGLIVFSLIIPQIILAPFLVKLVYGSNYLPAVKIIYYLAPFAIFSGFAVGVGSLFRTLNKMKIAIIINSIIVLVGAIPSYYIIKNYGLFGISMVIVIWFFLSDLIGFFCIKKYLK